MRECSPALSPGCWPLQSINAWLYFEFPLGDGLSPGDCSISNTVFFNDFKGQKNVIEYREETSRKILSFTGEQRTRALDG